MDQQGKDLLEINKRLFSGKQNVDTLYQEIAEYFYCERANFFSEITLGENFAEHLTDFYPTMVRRELGDQINAMVRPGDRPWFSAKATSKQISRVTNAKKYLEHMTDVNRSVLYSRDSGFRRAAKEAEHDFATFGMGYMQVSYNKNRDNLLFKTHHPKDCASQEGPDGQINHVHRRTKMTAQSMAHWFGEGKLPQAAKDALKRKDSKATFKVVHCFIPLELYDPYRKFPKSAKWADVYVAEGGAILKETPAFTMDYIVPRWQTVSGHVYAFSPATIIALPQARMIQRMMITLIEAGEKQVDPPMIATEDAINSPVDITAGGITYIDAQYDERMGASLRPLELGKNVNLGRDLMQEARSMLADAFYINKLQPIGNASRTKTAYETSQLVQEYIRNALPLFEPIEDEWTGRILEVTTEKVMRAGGYGPTVMMEDGAMVPENIPQELLGQNITFEFNNALKEARDQQTVEAYAQSGQLIAQAAQVDPSVMAEVDTKTMFRDAFGSVTGGSADWLVDEKVAAMARSQAQEQMQEQQALQQLDQGAQIANNVGQAAQSLDQIEAA